MIRSSTTREEDEQRWADLMRKAHGGDRLAYESLLSELNGVIEVYIRVKFGDLRVLEDCVQECLLAIHNARHTYDAARPFRPWMFTIIRNKTIDVLRRESTRGFAGDGDQAAVDALAVDDPSAALGKMIDGVDVLKNLSGDHREAILLTKYVGYTTLEASRKLEITETAFKARLHRALKAVNRELNREPDD